MNKHQFSYYVFSICTMLNFFAAIDSVIKPNHYVWVFNAIVCAICLMETIEEYDAYNRHLY